MDVLLIYHIDVDKVRLYYIPCALLILFLFISLSIALLSNDLSFESIICKKDRLLRSLSYASENLEFLVLPFDGAW